ncbi:MULTISPECIES: delta-aminolevulinic acid dehydratase [Clostridia]|uniref:delta-aminolevulinic acid dehydratase n=1 Tax=Clostridia TaxID=186801 RepID=UPI000EA060F8|nr:MULTISPECIES: delta-aminolevulinic acid dehydratase [Clostridia]NBJ68022.1 delta-aminolevulinic acid dehydratase [Roseburia sp. 1XD42-34]RKI82463.1 delta-aminolevulinic acid dehydratase [Clostridium sp. 1xD42-85]
MSKPELYVSLAVGPDCAMESYALRSTLESFGVRVTMHWIGRPNDLVNILSGEDREDKMDYLILNFHGDEGRFYINELAEEIYEPNEPKGEFFCATDVLQFAKLEGIKIIAAGCTLGSESLAKAFLKSGCHSYLGPDDDIDGNANLMFIIRFMYEIINNKKNQQEAFEIAKSIDQETSMFKIYSA